MRKFGPAVIMMVLPAVLAAETLRAQQDADASRADSLAAVADSLARRADSLQTVVDELTAPKPAPGPEEENPWDGSFGLGVTLNRGNTKETTVVSTIALSRDGDRTRFISNASATYTNSSEGPNSNKGKFSGKYELNQSDRFYYFASLDLDYDRQAAVDLRMAPGLGVGVSAVDRQRVRLDFNFGANPVTEYLRYQPNRTRGHYLASESFELRLNDRARLGQKLTWKPRFNKTEDYLLYFDLSLTSHLFGNFDMKMNLESRYNSRPPQRDPPIKRQDWMFYTALSYSFW